MPDEANFVFVGESLRIPSKLRNVKIVVIFKVRSVLVRTLLLNNEMPQPYGGEICYYLG